MRGCHVHLVGSIHSSNISLEHVKSIRPTHMFVESTRDLLGLLRSNQKYAESLQDLPALIKYSDENRLPLHAIDTSASDLTSRVLHGLGFTQRAKIWRYVALRKLLNPITSALFDRIIHFPATPFDTLIARWNVSDVLVNEVRTAIAGGASPEDVEDIIESRQNVSSFLSSAAYDPTEYIRLCKETGIDKRLESAVIGYRNDYISHQIRRVLRTIPEGSVCAVIVGKNHIQGIEKNLTRGMDFVPESLSSHNDVSTRTSFIDQLLLAQLLHL